MKDSEAGIRKPLTIPDLPALASERGGSTRTHHRARVRQMAVDLLSTTAIADGAEQRRGRVEFGSIEGTIIKNRAC